jgi:hypothetical protein
VIDPKVLWIALDDSDEWAHRGDRPRYLEILNTYDLWLVALMEQVARDDQAKGTQTSVIVTTDHGRALGASWTDHEMADGESKVIWMLERAPGGAVGDPLRVEPHLRVGESLAQWMGGLGRGR